jgi:hypothetical protein
MAKPKKQLRRCGGSILLLMLLGFCFVIVPAAVLMTQLSLYSVDKGRTQAAVEAAGLVAANDLSKIIINDPNFGYVSLSNYPPIGKATCAEDGEPLPVVSINTLVGTVRQNTIIARQLNNKTMLALSEQDRTRMQSTIKTLNGTLKAALAAEGKEHFTDIQGASVQPAADVTAFLKANLPAGVRLQSIKLTNGWLAGGADSSISLPQPPALAQIKADASRAGKYKAFSDIPVENDSFTFAGLGSTSTIVSNATFQPADDKHICSIVKVECTVALDNIFQPLAPFGLSGPSQVQAVACSQPFTMPDVGPTGALTLRFSSGPVVGLQSWSDFLGGGFHDNQITTYEATGGDYPTDHEARMIAAEPRLPPSTSQQFAEHLYYWLRNGHLRPRIDAVLAMINDPFRSGPAQIYAYEFAKNGSISRRIIARDPFPIGVTSDSQNQTVVDTSIQGGLSPIIVFRDDVKMLGTTHGGQHAGQPLAGYPLNWCEIPEYGGDEHMAGTLEKGRLGTGLAIIDPRGTATAEEAINDANFSLFQSASGKRLFLQPRRSFYSGGLALDIEIGGTGNGQPVEVAASAPALNIQTQQMPTGPGFSTPTPGPISLTRPIPAVLNVPNKLYLFANRKI